MEGKESKVMALNFENYSLFSKGKLHVPSNDKQWNSNMGVAFKANLSDEESTTLDKNVQSVLSDAQIVERIVLDLGTIVQELAMKEINANMIKQVLDIITSVGKLVTNIKSLNLNSKKIKLLIKNLTAYIICSYTNISAEVKDEFCKVYSVVFDEVWKEGAYVEKLLENECAKCNPKCGCLIL